MHDLKEENFEGIKLSQNLKKSSNPEIKFPQN